MDHNKKPLRPFGMRDKLGYMFGDFGNDFTYLLSSSFFIEILYRCYGCQWSSCWNH